jgi:hypothetical protein
VLACKGVERGGLHLLLLLVLELPELRGQMYLWL